GAAEFTNASCKNSDLREADLSGADLSDADFTGSKLSSANLQHSRLAGTTVGGATFNSAKVYGISVWDLRGEPKDQRSLVITPDRNSQVTVDQLELAQFVYFILDTKKITKVFNAMTGKAVLVLGRFTDGRKRLLEAMKDKLRQQGYLPIIFDFQKPKARDLTETIHTLAGLSRFVIANIGKPRSVQQELQATIPNLEIPFLPIIEKGEQRYSMFRDLERKAWVAKLVSYADQNDL